MMEVETLEQKEVRSLKKRNYYKEMIANETLEQKKLRNRKKNEYTKKRRRNETPEHKKVRLKKSREYFRIWIANETPEQRETRLKKIRERNRIKIKNEIPEQKEARLKKVREKKRKKRENETLEQREARLKKRREKKKEKIANETLEQKKLRILSEKKSLYKIRLEKNLKYFDSIDKIARKLNLPYFIDERIKKLFRKVLYTDWAGRKTVISLVLICIYQVCNQLDYPVKFRYLLLNFTNYGRGTHIFRKTHAYYQEFLGIFNFPKV